MNTLQKKKLRGTGVNCGLIVLLFAIALQLVVNHSSAVDTLLGVAAVALIFVIKKFLQTDGDDAPAGDGRP